MFLSKGKMLICLMIRRFGQLLLKLNRQMTMSIRKTIYFLNALIKSNIGR